MTKRILFSLLLTSGVVHAMGTPTQPKSLPSGTAEQYKERRDLVNQHWSNDEVMHACLKVMHRVRNEELRRINHSRYLAGKILDIIEKRKNDHK